MKEKVFFTSDKHVLAGVLYLPDKKKKQTGLLFFQGGGSATKERYAELQTFLAQKGYPSFAFDFRGVGESEGNFAEGSLHNRLEDAKSAYKAFQQYVTSIIGVGCSMGGHIAARVSEEIQFDGLVFLYAAAYSEQAEDKHLNEEFTQTIRMNERWKSSPVFASLRKYTKSVLILYGENDSVIPKGVQSMYSNSVAGPRRTIIIPNGPHLLLTEDASRLQVYNEIERFLHTVA